MIKVKVPASPNSSQRLEIDQDGNEFIIKLRWISKYQRFYMSIYDSFSNPLITGVKLTVGAPINIGHLVNDGPQGIFVIQGSGKQKRVSFEDGSYTLYYISRGKKTQFPLTREYLISSDVFEFITNYTLTITPPALEEISFIDGEVMSFIDGETIHFVT